MIPNANQDYTVSSVQVGRMCQAASAGLKIQVTMTIAFSGLRTIYGRWVIIGYQKTVFLLVRSHMCMEIIQKKCLTSYSICFDPILTGECEGDCDKDGDCGPGLKCFQRDDEPVAGCVGAGQSGIDYCWDYTLSEQPTLSPSVSPTPKVRVLSPSSSNRYSLITLVLISSTLPHPSAYLYLFTAHVKSINDSDAIT